MDEPMARVVTLPDGTLALEDPIALAVLKAVQDANLREALSAFCNANRDRVNHFLGRMKDRQLSPADAVIVLISVDDPVGRPLADALMPGYDWQQIRDMGQAPVARGLGSREGVIEFVGLVDPGLAAEARSNTRDTLVVVVLQQKVMIYYVPPGTTI